MRLLGSACEKAPGLPVPRRGLRGGSWPGLQKAGFDLAEEAAVAPSLPFRMVLLPKWHLRFLNNTGHLCGGDE